MHAIEPGAAGRAWAALGRTLPRPRAALVASAHWETSVPMLTGNAQPSTIHDFGGFPAGALRRCAIRQRARPKSPRVRSRCSSRRASPPGIDGCRGLDHGAWVPLMHMWPAHDVPVVQVSLQPGTAARAHHVALGRALAPLAGEGVLIVGSGHTTHNLRDWIANRRRQRADALCAGLRRVGAGRRSMRSDTEALVEYRDARARRGTLASDRRALPAASRGVGRCRRASARASACCRDSRRARCATRISLASSTRARCVLAASMELELDPRDLETSPLCRWRGSLPIDSPLTRGNDSPSTYVA